MLLLELQTLLSVLCLVLSAPAPNATVGYSIPLSRRLLRHQSPVQDGKLRTFDPTFAVYRLSITEQLITYD